MNDTASMPVRVLLDTLTGYGVKTVVCSPGSRNTPLVIAADQRKQLCNIVVVDERTAAFTALGIALVSQEPVMLVCTSGTAALNYSPALAEAYYQGVPLIAVTADRPKEWIDQDDSQTIRQDDLYRNYIKAGYDIISGRDDATFEWYVNRIANEGMHTALSGRPGPVHFNIRLDNPLNTTLAEKDVHTRQQRIIRFLDCRGGIDRRMIDTLAQENWNKKILLVCGYSMPDAALTKAVGRMSRCSNVTVMAETISNVHLPEECYSIDSTLRLGKLPESLTPDIVITTGGALVSRKLKEWLRSISGVVHWDLSEKHALADCFMNLQLRIESPAASFLSTLAGAMTRYAGDNSKAGVTVSTSESQAMHFAEGWKQLRRHALRLTHDYLAEAPWSDFKAFGIILRKIKPETNLFLSNGTSIRYAQILSNGIPHACYCNRGVSGIDGCTSTAIGGSLAYGSTTLLMTGDMSFAYDIGALGTRLATPRMKIIVFNNGGGGIFRFIRSTSDLPQLDKYFCADPKAPVAALAEAYGWCYYRAENEEQLHSQISGFMCNDDRPAMMEIVTSGTLSANILKQYFEFSKISR